MGSQSPGEDEGLRVVVTVSENKKNSKFQQRRKNCIEDTFGEAVIIGPFQSKFVIQPFKVRGNGIKGLIPIGQLNKVLHTVTYGIEGRIRIQLYNYSSSTKMLSHKLALGGVLLEENVTVEYEECYICYPG